MIKGIFQNNLPFISVTIGSEINIQERGFVLDTGFTGFLQITPTMAQALNLQAEGVATIKLANGTSVPMTTTTVVAALEGQAQKVTTMVADSLPLVGIKLLMLFGYKAIINCKYRTVELERAD